MTRLRAAGCVFAEQEATLLLQRADPDRLEELVRRRIDGSPLEHLLGEVDFDGLRLQVGPGCFVPRQRTVQLARTAAGLLPASGRLVDLCAGVGAVGAWIRRHRGDVDVHSVELDPVAAGYAVRNDAGTVLVGDLDAPLPSGLAGRVDVLTANAPYVPTDEIALMPSEARDHEPPVALDGGPDGVDLHRRIIAAAGHWLAPGGHLLIESTTGQIALVGPALVEAGLLPPEVSPGSPPLPVTLLVARAPR